MKIISGGQTGVDQGALDAALDLSMEVGGWCTRGRANETGRINSKYEFLQETSSRSYADRTKKNIEESDATLILSFGGEEALGVGSRLTVHHCFRIGRPYEVIDLKNRDAVRLARNFLGKHNPKILNVAGSRESKNPGIQELTRKFIKVLMRERNKS